MVFSMCCEDDLLQEFIKFKHGESVNNDTIEKFLHYYKPKILPTKEQFSILDNDLKSELVSSTHIYDDLSKALLKTIYKICLSNTKNDFPYVNINGDEIENNLTGTFKSSSRGKAIAHIKALLENANYIVIYDQYMGNNFKSFKDFIEQCIPQKRLTLECFGLNQDQKTTIKQIHNSYTVKDYSANNISPYQNGFHDRYILIDRKVEIILTSGIDYLMNNKKDFTYIIRKLK
jgi:hypothetical protein